MRYAIFADIHSNLEALESFEKRLKAEKVDECLCVGDIVGYGANPGECISKVKEIASVIVAGNHDWAVAEKFDIDRFNWYAKDAILWTRRNISVEEKEFLSNLPLVYETATLAVVHGNLASPEDFSYVLSVTDAEQNMKFQKTPFCFISHSHVPEIYLAKGNLPARSESKEIAVEEGIRYLVNVGSVGQPRDGDSRAAYCIFDTDKMSISIKRFEYDIKKAHDKILAAGLPSVLAYRLFEGR